MKILTAAPRALAPLALAGALLAIAVPSRAVADRSDLLLAFLVFATAMGITATELRDDVRRHRTSIAILSVAPLIVLSAAAWLIGRPFDEHVRDGLLATGTSSSEVAAVGLVTLAGADATVALGAVAGSLVASAMLGPVAIGALAGHPVHGGTGHLLGRFALVVIAPLVSGVVIRSLLPRIAVWDAQREGLAAIALAALVYAALSGTAGAHGLASALVASLVFLAVSAVLAETWHRATSRAVATPGALCVAMRDFAVAAALASQAFGPRAGAVPGIYGVVMLLAGSAATGRLAARSKLTT